MLTVVIYDSKFGNNEKIAGAIARGAGTLGSVRVTDTTAASAPLAERPDLLLVGGPTQRRAMSPGLREFVDSLAGQGVSGVATGSFDTRYRGSTWLMGSAAGEATKRLKNAGARVVAPPESFFVEQEKAPRGVKPTAGMAHLLPGELERAEAWAAALVTAVASRIAKP